MGKYFVAHLAARFKIHKNFTLTGRIENLFDKKYQEIYGYNTPGFSIYGGIEFTW
jgi:vitamin B12 transporter